MHAAAAGIDVHALSFGDFVEITRDLTHVHLVPQITFVSDERGGCTVDFIGRFERLAQDFAVIKSRLGIDVELAWHNRSNHDHYRSYYCDHTRRLVGDLYRKDVEAFGYEF
jgi:chondroitin 4-sulfotransferase 11